MTEFYASLADDHLLWVCTTDGDFLRHPALPQIFLGAPGRARGKQLVSDTSSYFITLLPAISD